MAFTEFCCLSGGSNLNAGTRTGNSTEPGTAAFKTYVSGTWVQATRTFTPAGGANPTTDGIAVGDFVSVYPDAATVSPYVARITTVGATTFVTDATAKAGTAPADGALSTSAKIGGAWKGPNAAESFPFNFVAPALTNAAGSKPRVNLKNDAVYSITAVVNHTIAGVSVFQGYTTAYGDLGRATIQGPATGAAIGLLALSGDNVRCTDLIFTRNGDSSGAASVDITGNFSRLERCVVHTARGGSGFSVFVSQMALLIECEAYGISPGRGIEISGPGYLSRCISHDNAAQGFKITGSGAVFNRCIAESNGTIGFEAPASNFFVNCDAYNNTGDGMDLIEGGARSILIENCNFVKNGGYGIDASTPAMPSGILTNCGFGSGTQANTSGNTNALGAIAEIGSVNYAADVTPWVDPANGDFRINLATAKGAGRGTFTQTAASYAGTIGYPDIGAAQHQDAGGGGGGGIIGQSLIAGAQ